MNHPNRNKRAAKRGPHPTGAEIRQTRLERGQTQAEAAASILVATKTWQDYELERRKMPPGLWEYYCLQTAFPNEMDKLITRWRHRAQRLGDTAQNVNVVNEPRP